jgi:hypothetical protein
MLLMADIAITSIVYLFVPMLIWFAPITDRTLSPSTLKKIVIINGVCCWLLIAIVSIETGGNGPGAAVFLWSWVAYKMLKKKFVTTKQNTDKDKPQEKNEYIGTLPKPNRTDTTKNKNDIHICISKEGETPVRYGNLAITGNDVRLETNRVEEKTNDACDDITRLRREIDEVLAEQFQAATRGDSALAQQLFDRYIFLLSRLEKVEKDMGEKNKDEAHQE